MGIDATTVDALTAEASRLIWNAYRGYTSEVFDRGELEHFVRTNVVVVLDSLARDALPASSELSHARELGELRARQGVPLESVIQAFRSTERVLLLHVQDTRRVSADTRPVERTLSCFDALTNAMIDAYRDASSALDAIRARAEEELGTALTKGLSVDDREFRRWAEVLEVDPDRPSACLLVDLARRTDPLAGQRFHRRAVSRLTASGHGPVVSRTEDDHLILFVGADDGRGSDALRAVLHELLRVDECTGVYAGDPVPNLSSAHASFRQAVRVRDAARGRSRDRGRLWSYRDLLLDVLLRADGPALRDFARDRVGVLAARPELLDTIAALAECNLSQARAATHLFVHVNTVALRARRIHELTGRNPLTFADLVELHLAARHLTAF